LADLEVFAEEKSKQEIHTLNDYALFYQEFRRLATCLAKERKYWISASTRPMKTAFILTYTPRSCFTYMMKILCMREARHLK